MMLRRIDIILYLLAFIVLIVPYSVMILSNKLEPYPAIILPDGSSTVSYDTDNIEYSRIKLLGVDKLNGQQRVINSDLFFDPIPSNRIYGFTNNSFGVADMRNDTFRFRRDLLSPIVTSKNYTTSDTKELNSWYRSKLIAQGFLDSSFFLVVEYVTIDRRTSEIIDSSIYSQENYLLHD